MDGHLSRTAVAQGDDQQVVFVPHQLIQFPMQLFQGQIIESAAEHAVLNPFAVALQLASDVPQPFGVANVIADQMPVLVGHDRVMLP